jgi:disulfide bond formation protein DsbB
MATLGALTYQFIYLTPVCLDCWWQRIFMFPLEIIVLVSLLTKNKLNHILIGVMASCGILLSAHHYGEHFERYVLGNSKLVPCSPTPGEPLCGLAPTVTFGFITIPFMAFVVFATIIWLSYLAHRKSKESLVA